jgi:hypothetical protein
MPVNGVFYSQTKGLVISTNSLNRVFVQTGGTTTFTGITSGNTIVEVQGTSGQVFKVTDCSNGVLFSSNNVSGQAILQTNSCGSIIGGIGSSSTANATTIGGGCNNSTTANFATIGGGCLNTSCNCYSTIGGGQSNTSSGYGSTIGGGQSNTSSSCNSTIGGGSCNANAACYSTIGGGRNNSVCSSSDNTTIGGGRGNYIDGNSNTYSTIGGGFSNCILNSSQCSTIIGGRGNSICNSNRSSILGGYANTINGYSDVFIIGCCITATIGSYSFMNNLCVFGNVTKGGGSFKISHPNPDKNKTHYLIHSFVESPTAGDNIYRYEVESIDGVAEINLPDYFSYLNENIQVWVSGKNNFGNGYGEVSVDLKKIEIHTSIDGLYNVLVIGTRKDDHAKKYWKGTETLKENKI